MQELIRICEVEKYYGTASNVTKAINRVSFQVEKGEFVGIMGASGSGKSTLLNLLSTIDHVTSGHIYYGNTDITEMNEEQLAMFRKESLGFVFQNYNLLDTLTMEENITLALTLRKKPKEKIQKITQTIMQKLGIWDIRDKFPSQVSGGQKQRCACARAIVNHPQLILADEPTGALDSGSARLLMETFCTMNAELEATILMVTHDVFSASYCKRILFLKDGAIFHEMHRGNSERRAFLNKILDVLASMGGDIENAF